MLNFLKNNPKRTKKKVYKNSFPLFNFNFSVNLALILVFYSILEKSVPTSEGILIR